MYNTKIIEELVKALEPLMAELDLFHTLHRQGLHDRMVFWRPGEGEWRSPMEVMLKVQSETGLEQLDWADLEIGIQDVLLNPVGTNGWHYYFPVDPMQGESPGDRETVLELIETRLRTEPFYPTGTSQPNIPDHGALLSLWHELEYALPDDADVIVDRDSQGNETLSFVYDRQSFEVIFSFDYRAGVELRIDGEDSDRSKSSTTEVTEMMKRHLAGLGYRRW
ncbi:hypothetical protein [Neorhizobium vignae]|uniref:hypothetical protein n=1 Tax=Neorhizobium vignae TaxID=690585 RepID=UPI00055C358B|nr:hypothetical protein [Neorhizobium vignae]